MLKKIQLRRDNSTNWSENNPILDEAELGIDITLKKIKIGDGETAWSDLSFIDNGFATETYVNTAIQSIQEIDLSGLATETYVNTAIENIPPPEIDLSGLATETYVNTAIENSKTIFYTVKIIDDGSGTQETFEFNGNLLKSNLGNIYRIDFIVGNTYRFDLSDTSNSARLRFSTTPDTSVPSSITPYTTNITEVGVSGEAGAYTEILITKDTPDLYFYAAEDGLGDTSNIGGSVKIQKLYQELWNGTELLLNGETASLTRPISYFSPNPAAQTATLLAGSEGQIKVFATYSYQDLMVITVTNAGWKASGNGTITFSQLGQACTLQYINGKWFCIGNNGASFDNE